MIVLRDYQEDAIVRTGEALRRSRRALLVLPPGGGKTVIAAFIAQRFASRGQQVYFNCHRSELLQQTSLTFTRAGLSHGYIAAGHPMQPSAPVQICSIDTLKNRLSQINKPRAVIWDETHHIGAAGWAAIMEAWPEAVHIGLTGTPWRLDGTGLGKFYDEMVIGPTAAELIDRGALAPYRIFAPSAPDMQGVKRIAGDFAQKETAERMDKPKLTGDMIDHWKKHASELLTVGYGVTVEHSKHMAAQFNHAGIPAAHLDADTPKAERVRIIQELAQGRIKVLFNKDLFGEGFDLAAIAQREVRIGCAILGRPTNSLSLYLQQSMRCMRPGGDSVILDHAGNSARHGFPDDEREWSLEGRAKGRKAANDNAPPPPVTCPGCFMQIRRPTPPGCPHCGKELQPEAAPPEVAEGELVEVGEQEKRRIRQELAREQAEARTLDELVALGAQRGYKNPMYWAQQVLGGRRR